MARNQSALVNWSQYAGLRCFAGLLQCFNPEENLRTATAIARLYQIAAAKRCRRAIRNIELSFPDWSRDQVYDTAHRSIEHMFRMFMVDAISMPRLITPHSWHQYIRFGQMEEALDVLASDQPAVLVTGHCGNWELLGYALSMLGYPMHALARPLDNPILNEWLLNLRQEHGLTVVTKWGATTVVQDQLRRGGKIGFIADQNAGEGGLFVPFFGRLASCYKSMGILAMRYRATIVVGHAHRLGDTRMKYEIGGNDIIRPHEWADQPDPLFYLTARMCRAIENMIRVAPEQYIWIHRRWKSRPKHERDGKPIPERLVEKIRALPWMTEPELDRIIELSNNPPGEAMRGW